MGYDVHTTRAEEWSQNEGQEIAPPDWLMVVEADPELELVTSHEPYTAEWVADGAAPDTFFDWDQGNISAKNPDETTVIKMEQIARRLNARVQGDDGEFYEGGQPTG